MDTQALTWDRRPYHGGFLEWIETETPESAAVIQRHREGVLRDHGAGIALSDVEPTDEGVVRLTIVWAMVTDRPATFQGEMHAGSAASATWTQEITLSAEDDGALLDIAIEFGAIAQTGWDAGQPSIETLLTMIARGELGIGWPVD